MKSILTIASLTLAFLLGALFGGVPRSAAQEGTSPREAILASIPSLANFEEQADTTFVGNVEGSYAFIAFVIRDGFAVVYLCDSVQVSQWLSGEIVNGTLDVTAEDGTRVAATIFDDHIGGTVTLTTDDDGSEAQPHAFTAVPAAPGETGLARYVWEDGSVSGWIVNEEGIRGKRLYPGQCSNMMNLWESYKNLAFSDQVSWETNQLYLDAAYEVYVQMAAAGCPEP